MSLTAVSSDVDRVSNNGERAFGEDRQRKTDSRARRGHKRVVMWSVTSSRGEGEGLPDISPPETAKDILVLLTYSSHRSSQNWKRSHCLCYQRWLTLLSRFTWRKERRETRSLLPALRLADWSNFKYPYNMGNNKSFTTAGERITAAFRILTENGV